MDRKIKIRKVSLWCSGITIALTLLFAFLLYQGQREFQILRLTTDQYILCERAAKQLQDASDYLTEQVRLYAMTGQSQYMDLYFKEAKEEQHREHALEDLSIYFDGTEMFLSLQEALAASKELMNTEYYSMRLVAEAEELSADIWPKEIEGVQLSGEDQKLGKTEKIAKAQRMVCDEQYGNARAKIVGDVSNCMNGLITQTQNKQRKATTIFSDMYFKLEIGIVILIFLLLGICLMMKKLIVEPLVRYNESITQGGVFPVIGAEELQNLALTYNQVYLENQETQRLIRHQAEHDALTEALNRGSFEKILKIYDTGESSFALILIDVDTFKSVNDTYGHATGDIILKKVAALLKRAFRSVDYVCRIGGDEFAIIMVEMTSDLQYTIRDKIAWVNEELGKAENGVPAVSLSVGVAFSDRENPGESIFKDADQALYYVKENGRNGCSFY